MLRDKLAWKMLLLLHDVFTGKPQVAPRLLCSGLAAAELSELIMARYLAIEGDYVIRAPMRDQGLDELDALVMGMIASQSGAHTVRSWVQALGEPVYDVVTKLAVREGTVRRQSGARRLTGRGPTRFPAVDLITASGPRLRLEHKLRTPVELDEPAAVLAGVLGALKLDRIVDVDRVDRDRAAVRASLAAATSSLPIDLRSLIAGVEAAADASATLGHGSPIGPMHRRGSPVN